MEGENHAGHVDSMEGEDGVDPNSVRGCAFDGAEEDESEMTSSAQRRIGSSWWVWIMLLLGALSLVLGGG